jgi:aminocarboxymuconate-semialdehyde decarboxylase
MPREYVLIVDCRYGSFVCFFCSRLSHSRFRNYAECQEHITQLPSEFAKRFYYDTCSFYTPAIMMARDIVGVDRLLFGTDYPFIDRGAEHVAALPLPQSELSRILGANAQQLLKL